VAGSSFNRTAYGIEIRVHDIYLLNQQQLLIAPLMELKSLYLRRLQWEEVLLIAPLMELKYLLNRIGFHLLHLLLIAPLMELKLQLTVCASTFPFAF